MDEDAVVRPTALHAKLNSTKLNLNLKKKEISETEEKFL